MYYFGISGSNDNMYLVECEQCNKIFKYDKKYFLETDGKSCTLSTPLVCNCGNKSGLKLPCKFQPAQCLDDKTPPKIAEENTSKPNTTLIVIAIIFVLWLIGSIAGNNGNVENNNGMSKEYNTNSEYRRNVDSVSKTYGESPKNIERGVNAVVEKMK